jgi:hypothetical protein
VNDLFAPLMPQQMPAATAAELITFAANDPQVPDDVLALLVHLLNQERLMPAPKPVSQPAAVTLSPGDVARLRGYLARAAALLDEASATDAGARIDALLRERHGVLGEMVGYLDAVLGHDRDADQ